MEGRGLKIPFFFLKSESHYKLVFDMLVIEQKMLAAVNGGYNWELRNTSVIHSKKQICVFLYNNLIAAKNKKTGKWEFSCCGWHTATTRSRLNALGCDCRIKNFRFVGVDSHIIKLAW